MVAFTLPKVDGSNRVIDENTLKDSGEMNNILKQEFLNLLKDKTVGISKGKEFVNNLFNNYMEWGESVGSDSDRKQLRKDISKAYFDALEDTTYNDLIEKQVFKGGLQVVSELVKGKKAESYFKDGLDSLLMDEYKKKLNDVIDAYSRAGETLLENAKWRAKASKEFIEETKNFLDEKSYDVIAIKNDNRKSPLQNKIDPVLVVKFKEDDTIGRLSFKSKGDLEKDLKPLFNNSDMKKLAKTKNDIFDDKSEYYEHEVVTVDSPKSFNLGSKLQYGIDIDFEQIKGYSFSEFKKDLLKLREEKYGGRNVIEIPIFAHRYLLGDNNIEKLQQNISKLIKKTYNTLTADVTSNTNDVHNLLFEIQLGGSFSEKKKGVLSGIGSSKEFDRILEGIKPEEGEEDTRQIALREKRKASKEGKEKLKTVEKDAKEIIKKIDKALKDLNDDGLFRLQQVNLIKDKLNRMVRRANTSSKQQEPLDENDLLPLFVLEEARLVIDGIKLVEKEIKNILKKEQVKNLNSIILTTPTDEKDEKKEEISTALDNAFKKILNYDVKRKGYLDKYITDGLTPTEASIKLENSKKIAEKIYGKDIFEDANKIKSKIKRETTSNNARKFIISSSKKGIQPKELTIIVDSSTGKKAPNSAKKVGDGVFIVPKKKITQEVARLLSKRLFGNSDDLKEDYSRGATVIFSEEGALPIDLVKDELNLDSYKGAFKTPSKSLDNRSIQIPKDMSRTDFEKSLEGKKELQSSLPVFEEDSDEKVFNISIQILPKKKAEYTIEPKKATAGTEAEETEFTYLDEKGKMSDKKRKRTGSKTRVLTTLNASARQKASSQIDLSIDFITLLLNKFRIIRRG